MKIIKKLSWIVFAIQLAFIIYVIAAFKVDDKTLAKGDIYDFNDGWVITREDGSSVTVSLPYLSDCPANEKIIAENVIPKEYEGLTMSFLSADKIFEVYIDDKLVYSFGTNDEKPFGNTPGSIEAFVDIPRNLDDGIIRIEMVSPYNNYAGNIGEITVAARDISILNLFKKNAFSLVCDVIILVSGILFFVLTVIQKKSRQKPYGMRYLVPYCLLLCVYHFIETKTLTAFWGNQTVYSMLVFLILMVAPMYLMLYYRENVPEKYEKILNGIIVASFLNVIIQVTLQILDIFDFMEMNFLSHGIMMFAIITIEVIYFKVMMKHRLKKDKSEFIQFIGLLMMGIGGIMDMIRNYTVRVGDLGKFSRYGLTVYCLIMVAVNISKVIKGYSAKVEENALLLKQKVEYMEEQNQLLLQAKQEADEARQEALAANASKSNFLANMSHEIRTPINAVLGMNTMILRESDNADILDYASNIQSAGQNLLSIINDILDISKIESGKLEIIPAEYALSSLLNDSYNMVNLRAKAKNLDMKLICQKDIPNKLFGDETRVRQIIINLLTNAVKYTKEGSVTISVSAEKKEEKNILLKISVKDTGIGISDENKEKLFEAFQRIEEKRNRNIEGTGLGLTITKQLLDMMGGSISVDSVYGEGSEFVAVIPQTVVSDEPVGEISSRYDDAAAIQKNRRKTPDLPSGDILVVDDVPMNLKVVTSFLKNTRIRIDTAQSGHECLRMAAEKHYDVIFLDHMMPEMDGVETLEKLKEIENNPNENTPVIMLTANAVLGAKEEYLQAGFSDYLAKPVVDTDLENILLKYLGNNDVEKANAENLEKQNVEEPQRPQKSQEPQSDNEFLEKLNFLNVKTGLEYCGDDEAVYKEILQAYIDSPMLVVLKNDYDKQDWDNYKIHVHGLKSTSLTIGAVKLSENAKKLEMACMEQNIDYIRDNHESVMKDYRYLLMDIHKAMNGHVE